ncbi:MAG: hypothetical protein HYX62_08200 [Gammaproteobacteria bacterium]|jgi:hypothetical protein|nr:hypothetical protein [Gammaproteobacteria bacterium]
MTAATLIPGYSAPPRRADTGVRQIAASAPSPALNRQVRQQVPAEQVVEGDILDKQGLSGAYSTSFHHTGRYTMPTSGESMLARRAVAEYWSLSLMESGRISPLHRIDDYA